MSGIPFKFFWLIWFPIVRMQGLVTHKFSHEFLSSNICPNAYVAGAFRNSELCRITKFSQEVVKNGR